MRTELSEKRLNNLEHRIGSSLPDSYLGGLVDNAEKGGIMSLIPLL